MKKMIFTVMIAIFFLAQPSSTMSSVLANQCNTMDTTIFYYQPNQPIRNILRGTCHITGKIIKKGADVTGKTLDKIGDRIKNGIDRRQQRRENRRDKRNQVLIKV